MTRTTNRKQVDSVVVQWNGVALQAVRNARLGPPMVARALAIVHTCMFDAWAVYDSSAIGTALGDLFRRPPFERTVANKLQACSYAAHAALKDLFPGQIALFDDTLKTLGFDPASPSATIDSPSGIGRLAAQAVLAYRHGDGSNQLGDLHSGPYSDYTGYTPVNSPDQLNDPNQWQPLRLPDGAGGLIEQRFLAPHWGLVVPFAISSGAQLRPTGPRLLPRDAEEYRQQCVEVLSYSAGLSDRQKVIAEYWADGPKSETPPGHWSLFAQFVSRRDRHGVDDDVKLFFVLTNALLDASICCWDTKRAYNYVRPISAIRYLMRDQKVIAWRGPGLGTGVVNGEEWRPYQADGVVTPPFPEFPSGHSTFSAAAAEVLRRYTGSDAFGLSFTAKRGTSIVEPGLVPRRRITLSWNTFSEAAAEAGLSRRFGGIHFAQGDLIGRALGRTVAAAVWEKAHAFICGVGHKPTVGGISE